MKLYNATLALIIFLVSSIHDVRCLKCYQCRSDRDKKCGAKPSSKYLKECTERPNIPKWDADNSSSTETTADASNATTVGNITTGVTDLTDITDVTGVTGVTGATASPLPLQVDNTTSTTTNTTKTFICRTNIQILYLLSNTEVVIRDCGTHYREDCYKITNKLIYHKVCDCKTEGCNRSSRTSANPETIVLLLLGVVASRNLLLKYLWNTKISL